MPLPISRLRVQQYFTLWTLLALAVCGFLTSSAQADTLLVPTQFATIQAAINAAAPGDTVLLADGTYTGSGNHDLDFGGKAITVRSQSGDPANCILDCQQNGCGFIFQSGETAASAVADLTIQNGMNYNGGGMYLKGSSPTITHCTFTGNTANNVGGGMYNFSGNPTLTNCTFTGNNAVGGGGMFTDNDGNPTLTNCTFTKNNASNGFGGGLYIDHFSNLILINCTFTENNASDSGGGMQNDGDTTLINCTFADNNANVGGGMANGGNPTLTNCTFTSNNANVGGGLYNESGKPTLTNCTFTGNNASDGPGGGLYNLSNNPALTNCILWGNTANGSAGIFSNSDHRSSVRLTYTDDQDLSNSTPDANHNFSADPRFVRSPFTNGSTDFGDLHLQFGSPTLDTGNDAAITVPPFPADANGQPLDLDGNPRISRAHVDLGAYEYQNQAPIANAQSLSLPENANLPITLTGSDPENDALTYTGSAPAHGTLSGTAPNLTYTPNSGYFGSDSFTFTVTDSYGAVSNIATVNLTVNAMTPTEVTGSVAIKASGFTAAGGANYTQTLTITNTTGSAINGPIYLVLDNLGGANVQLTNLSETTLALTPSGRPYLTLSGPLAAQGSVKVTLKFSNPSKTLISYTPRLFAGPGSL